MIDTDLVYAKISSIQKCLQRIRRKTRMDPELLDDWDVQDIFVLNLQRAIQSTVDIAAHVVSVEALGVPSTLRENFTLLSRAEIISPQLERKMIGMVGFRTIAVHDYQTIEPDILKQILQHHLGDLEEFYLEVLAYYNLKS